MATSYKGLTGDQKYIQQLVETLKRDHTKEFLVRPFDGLLFAAPKETYQNVTAIDSLVYELTSFGPGRDVGSGLLQYITPGSIVPLFPTAMKPTDEDVDLTSGSRFMDKVIILSGAHHIDKSADAISGVHEYDGVIAAMGNQLRQTERSREFYSFSNSVGADMLDATSDEALDGSYACQLFETFFPEIDQDHRGNYVLFITCHAKAALDYILGNLAILQTHNAKKVIHKKNTTLRVSPHTMSVVIDNEHLVHGTRGLCRMLICNDNPIMLNPREIESCYGENMSVKDPVLKGFNKTLKEGMVFEPKDCPKLPPSKFLLSMLTSAVLYDHPVPVELLPEQYSDGFDMMQSRLSVISQLYLKNKELSKSSGISVADQLAAMSVSVLKNTGISPMTLKFYRSDSPQSTNGEMLHTPWPSPLAHHIYENIKRSKETNSSPDATDIEEAMKPTVLQLLMLLNFRDHIFNVDIFKNQSELYDDYIKTTGKSVNKPGTELNQLRIKALCSWNIFRAGFGLVENVFSRFHYDPVAFKRFFVANALFYLSGIENVRMADSVDKCPLPESIDITNSTGIPVSEGANFTCKTCADTPFYERDGAHCLCFLLLKTLAKITGKQSVHLKDIKTVHREYFLNIHCNFVYCGKMTSYKTLHNLTMSETKSSGGHFGKILLQHASKPNGFGQWKKKLHQEDAVVTDQQTVGGDHDTIKEQTENVREKDNTDFQETRKMSWIIKSVRSLLGRKATLLDPETPDDGEIKNQYLWTVQRFQTAEENDAEPQDLRPCVYGTKDDPAKRTMTALLDIPIERVEAKPVSQSKRQITDWNIEDCDEPVVKKRKLGSGAEKEMTDFVKSLLYEILKHGNLPEDSAVKCFEGRHTELLQKWKKKPDRKNMQFRVALLKVLFGAGQSENNPVDPTDPTSLVAQIMESYLTRISAFISDVHDAVCRVLNLTPDELEDDHKNIVHYNEKTKRDLVSYIDLCGKDSMDKRSNMVTVFQMVRHAVEARASKTASETQVKKENADAILKNNKGPFCFYVEGNVKVHVPTLKKGENGELMLSVSSIPAEDVTVAFDMPLPVKMKVNLMAVEMDETKNKTMQPNFGCGTDSDMNQMVTDNVFVPQSLLNGYDNSVPAIVGAPKMANQLAEILGDCNLRFTNIGTPQFMDITKKKEIMDMMKYYLAERKGLTKQPQTHNLVMQEVINMINTPFKALLSVMCKATQALSRIVSISSDSFSDDIDFLSREITVNHFLAKAFQAACSKNISLATGLYVLALCSELYSPPSTPKNGNRDLERDNHALYSIVAGCLRLFIGWSDCNDVIKSPESKQVRIVPMLWTYLNGRDDPFVTTIDVPRVKASQTMMLLQIGSYTLSHSPSTVVTAPRGGAPITKNTATVAHGFVKKQFMEGEHNSIICMPLVTSINTTSSKCRETVLSMMESCTLQPFIRYVMDNMPTVLGSLVAHYEEFLPGPIEDCTKEEVLTACLRAHGTDQNDEDTELFKTIVFPNVYRTMTGSDEKEERPPCFMIEADENVWSDDE